MTLNQYLDLLPPHSRTKPRFEALCTSVLRQVADLAALAEATETGHSLPAAVGAQLDALGALLCVSRSLPDPETGAVSVLDDDAYRLLIRASAAKRLWKGTNETLPSLLRFVFRDRDASLTDGGDMSVTARCPGPPLPVPAEALFPVPAGVKLVCPETQKAPT